MEPSWVIFRAAMEYAELVTEESLESHYDETDETLTLEELTARVAEYVQEDELLVYEDDPTDIVIIKHKPTNTFWKGSFYHDSWNGTNYEEPYQKQPEQVELKPVVVKQWVEVK